MIPDAKLEPEYCYEENPPEIWEMKCPEVQYFACQQWMDREQLLKHYKEYHTAYWGMGTQDIEALFEEEREKRYS